jgi:anti-sigma B factor antagonist
MTAMQAPRLALREITIGGARGFALSGELDASTTAQFTEAVELAVWGSVGAFVLDLTELAFVDSAGLQALLRARAVLGREDRALAVLCPRGNVRRVLDLATMLDTLVVYSTREALAAALVPADD